MNTKIKRGYRYCNVARGMVSQLKFDKLADIAGVTGEFVRKCVQRYYVQGFNEKDVCAIFLDGESGNLNRDIYRIRYAAADFEELKDEPGIINKLVPGEVSERKLEIIVARTNIRSDKVKQMLYDHYVSGESINDIRIRGKFVKSNMNRDFKRVQQSADVFEELYILEFNQ